MDDKYTDQHLDSLDFRKSVSVLTYESPTQSVVLHQQTEFKQSKNNFGKITVLWQFPGITWFAVPTEQDFDLA